MSAARAESGSSSPNFGISGISAARAESGSSSPNFGISGISAARTESGSSSPNFGISGISARPVFEKSNSRGAVSRTRSIWVLAIFCCLVQILYWRKPKKVAEPRPETAVDTFQRLLDHVDAAVEERTRRTTWVEWLTQRYRREHDDDQLPQTPLNDTLSLVWRGDSLGNGLVSKRPVPKENVVFHLPPETLISDLNVRAAVAAGILPPKVLEKTDLGLPIYLALQRKLGRASRYSAYIDVLPDNFDLLPLNWMRTRNGEPVWPGLHQGGGLQTHLPKGYRFKLLKSRDENRKFGQAVLFFARNFTSSSPQQSEEGVGEKFPAVNASTRARDFQQRMLEQERAVLDLSKRALQDLDLADLEWARDAVDTSFSELLPFLKDVKQGYRRGCVVSRRRRGEEWDRRGSMWWRGGTSGGVGEGGRVV